MEEVVIRITRTAEGNVTVEGPLSNKLLCYGMLEIARVAVDRAGQRIVAPEFNSPYK